GEADAGQRGRDGAELAADLDRGVRLGVEGVVMAGSTLHPQEDAVDGPGGRGCGGLPGGEGGRQRQPPGGQGAYAEEAASRKACAVRGSAGGKVEHGTCPFQARREAKGRGRGGGLPPHVSRVTGAVQDVNRKDGGAAGFGGVKLGRPFRGFGGGDKL